MTAAGAVAQAKPGSRLSWPCYTQEEIDLVASILHSGRVNYWTGEHGREFEREYANHLGRAHAVAVANGTLALELCLYALGVGAGDEVIVPTRTFIASASCVVARGATPVVADVEIESQNLSAATIEPHVTPRTRAIIAVHLAGWPCDMDAILDLARRKNIAVVEDCAQAHGATYKGRPVGSFGDMAAFSFCQDKIVSTGGEGGLVATDDEDLWRRAWSYKDHGKSYDEVHRKDHPPGFRWLHESWGSNWRMTEIQSALGRTQLARLASSVEARRQRAGALSAGLSGHFALRLAEPPPNVTHSYYKYYAFVRPELMRPGWDVDRVAQEISRMGPTCLRGSCGEIYREKAFPPSWKPAAPLPNGRELAETALMFQVHPTLTLDEVREAAVAARRVLDIAASRPGRQSQII